MGCHFLLQGMILTLGLNPVLLHCRQILYHLSHQGSPLPAIYSNQYVPDSERGLPFNVITDWPCRWTSVVFFRFLISFFGQRTTVLVAVWWLWTTAFIIRGQSRSCNWKRCLVFVISSHNCFSESLSSGVLNLQDLMTDDLRWGTCNNNQVHNKCNVPEITPKPPSTPSVEKLSSLKRVPGARKAGDRCPSWHFTLYFLKFTALAGYRLLWTLISFALVLHIVV